MRLSYASRLAISASLFSVCAAFTVSPSDDASVVGNALFSGPGITFLQGSFSGASGAIGTFTNGPFGIGDGAILTTGEAVGAELGGNTFVSNDAPGSDYCGSNSYDGAVLQVSFSLDPGYNGLQFEYILASQEVDGYDEIPRLLSNYVPWLTYLLTSSGSPDAIGIYLGDTQLATEADGKTRITTLSPFLYDPYQIASPRSLTQYTGSSPPLLFTSPLDPGPQTLVLAVCDFADQSFDSGLLIKIEACVDCGNDHRTVIVNYKTVTNTVSSGEATSTSTQQASGTESGTVFVGVSAQTTTTAMTEGSATTTQEVTTSTEEVTTTTEEITTNTEDITTTTENVTTTQEVTTTTADSTTETTASTSERIIETSDSSTTTSATEATILTSDTTTAFAETTTSTTTDYTTETTALTSESTTETLGTSTTASTAGTTILTSDTTTAFAETTTSTTSDSTTETTALTSESTTEILGASTTISTTETAASTSDTTATFAETTLSTITRAGPCRPILIETVG
ncbi:hypothetical protein AK830_g2619 [Neonectria ditissima]|uniref:Uncharacterized protein n=1 Tax=Neonectria ditissima TaxID=78410 RepID=A0A0P7BAT8_9HYPO|nr:hypothetical protein AK830_g2619 [Neonectria ditissima]